MALRSRGRRANGRDYASFIRRAAIPPAARFPDRFGTGDPRPGAGPLLALVFPTDQCGALTHGTCRGCHRYPQFGVENRGCLDAVAAQTNASEIQTIVVDNASSDATLAEVAARGVHCSANPHNAGFAAAVNQGIRATEAPLILLLNPDAYLVTGIDALTAHFEDPRTGAAGGMLTGADGRPQTGFMARNLPTPTALIFEVLGINTIWPGNPVNWHYRCLGNDPVTLELVEQPAGAFLMFPREIWERVGGFDERFWPIWFEDVDFCARLKEAGLAVYYEPKAVARHEGAHSISTVRWRCGNDIGMVVFLDMRRSTILG